MKKSRLTKTSFIQFANLSTTKWTNRVFYQLNLSKRRNNSSKCPNKTKNVNIKAKDKYKAALSQSTDTSERANLLKSTISVSKGSKLTNKKIVLI